jgi:integrase
MDNETSYAVKIYKTSQVKGAKGIGHRVRWRVDGQPASETFRTAALADAFRSELITATRKGEAFNIETKLPVSYRGKEAALSWYDFVITWVDATWARTSANQRKNAAKALVPITVALLRNAPADAKEAKALRTALREYAFNRNRRKQAPADVANVLRFVSRDSRPMTVWEKPGTAVDMLDAISQKLDGTSVAGSTVKRNRRVLNTVLEYAVQRGVLTANPLPAVKRGSSGKSIRAIDKRSVLNPGQAEQLLAWVHARPRGGPRLHAFFATQRYAGLRPEESIALRVRDADLPEGAWGELLVHTATPEVGKHWTDSGEIHDKRHLKGREEGVTRPVPCCPELASILREHIKREKLKPSDLLFQGENGGVLAGSVYRRTWTRAREQALTPDEYTSPVAKRVYDLRHTCLTEWLNVPVPPAKVATWAGNSVAVLLETYALCIDGQDDDLKKRIDAIRSAKSGVTTVVLNSGKMRPVDMTDTTEQP